MAQSAAGGPAAPTRRRISFAESGMSGAIPRERRRCGQQNTPSLAAATAGSPQRGDDRRDAASRCGRRPEDAGVAAIVMMPGGFGRETSLDTVTPRFSRSGARSSPHLGRGGSTKRSMTPAEGPRPSRNHCRSQARGRDRRPWISGHPSFRFLAVVRGVRESPRERCGRARRRGSGWATLGFFVSTLSSVHGLELGERGLNRGSPVPGNERTCRRARAPSSSSRRSRTHMRN